MNYQQAEVVLNVNCVGMQAIRGSYTHFHKVGPKGDEINSIKVDKAPVFCKAFKTVHLGNEFVKGALSEPPENMRSMKTGEWRRIPEQKRIALHVNAYVRATTPEHRGYSMQIM